jgi:hypothetical protein
MASSVDRYVGAVLGLAACDALGTTVGACVCMIECCYRLVLMVCVAQSSCHIARLRR